MEYQHFLNVFIEILNKYATMKQKYLRTNKRIFITKELPKEIMKRSKKIFCDRTEIHQKECKNQQNFCENFLKKAKKEHFGDLDEHSVPDNK